MRIISKVMVLIMLFLFFGCAAIIPEQDRLGTSSRFSELQKHMEAEIGQSGVATTAQLVQLCGAYANLKRYDRLFECCERMENNIRKGDKSMMDFSRSILPKSMQQQMQQQEETLSHVTSLPYLFRAHAYLDLGQFEKAIGEAKKAYDMAMAPSGQHKKHLQIQASGLLSLAYALNGNRGNALKMIDQLESLRAANAFAGQRLINMELTKTYMALKEYRKALDVIRREDDPWLLFFGTTKSGDNDWISRKIANIVKKMTPEFAFMELPKLFLLNKCFMETGQINKAKVGYDTLLKIPQISDIGGIYWMILFDRGRITEQEGNPKEAISFYRQAVNIIEQQRSTINTEASKIGFVGDKQSVYHRLVEALYMDGQYGLAFEYVERSKSRALVDMLAVKQDFTAKSGDEQAIHNLLAKGTSCESELNVQDLSLNKSEMRSIVIKNRGKLIEQSPELASLVSVASLAVAEIQSNIPGDETLVEYYYAEKNMFAFILSVQGLRAVKLNGDRLSDDIQDFRKLLNNSGSSGYRELSQSLYARLIQPLASYVDNRNLIIVPHGALHYLPFNALQNGKEYFIEKYSIRTLPSASVIKYLQAKKSSKLANILVFGNPDLGDSRYNLVYAQNEAIAIAGTQPHSKVFLRAEATKTAFKKYAGDFNFIHFATHGQFNADEPLDSALLLAKDPESDGKLTVDNLYSSKIDADLVTLSACETGLGKIANGDDIVGLTRGFLYAGSSSIVASLWKVDDLATADLMTRFYTNMKTLDKREALRQAQLLTKKKYPHPFYWAAFQLTGLAK